MSETRFLAGLLLGVDTEGGAITPIMDWLHNGDHEVAPKPRSQGGAITPIFKWLQGPIIDWLHVPDH